MLFQIPAPQPGEIERWLLAAAALGGMALLVKNLFIRKPPIEAEFVTKTELKEHHTLCAPRLASLEREYLRREEFLEFKAEMRGLIVDFNRRVDSVVYKIDEMKSEILVTDERRAVLLHERLNKLEATLNRVDERTMT
jgi:hypothetical protein